MADVHLTPDALDCVATVSNSHSPTPQHTGAKSSEVGAALRRLSAIVAMDENVVVSTGAAQTRPQPRRGSEAEAPRLELPRGSQIVPLLALVLGAALTVASYKTSWIHLAYRLPRMHAVIDTTIGLVSLLVAYLVYGRVEVLHRQRDYTLAFALGLGGLVNLFAAVTQGVSSVPLGRGAVWPTMFGRLVVALLFAAAALTPSSRRKEGVDGPTFVGALVLAFLAMLGIVAVFSRWLPWSADLAISPTEASKALFVGPSLLLVAQGAVAVCYTIAGWQFSRRQGEHDDLMTWLASSCLLFALASVDYLAFPSIFSDWIYVGDVLRLAGVLLLLVGAAREITRFDAKALRSRSAAGSPVTCTTGSRGARVHRDSCAPVRTRPERSGRPTPPSRRRRPACTRRVQARDLHTADSGNASEQLALTAPNAARRFELQLQLDLPAALELAPELVEALSRIVREAITNTGHHTDASTVRIALTTGDRLVLEIVDDGDGFDATAAGGGFGLTGMRRTRPSNRWRVHRHHPPRRRDVDPSRSSMTIRVLIADDHAQFRAMVAEVLEEAGFEVCAQAATGDRAIELAVEYEPDVRAPRHSHAGRRHRRSTPHRSRR